MKNIPYKNLSTSNGKVIKSTSDITKLTDSSEDLNQQVITTSKMCLILASIFTLTFIISSPHLLISGSATNSPANGTILQISHNPSPQHNNNTNKQFMILAATTFQNKPPIKLTVNSTSLNKKNKELIAMLREVYKLDMKQKQNLINGTLIKINGTDIGKLKLLSGLKLSKGADLKPGNQSGKSSTKSHFGDDTSSSLFRPSFLKGLLSNQKSSNNEDEEEEVTQTIMMPIAQQHKQPMQMQMQHQQPVSSSNSDYTMANPSIVNYQAKRVNPYMGQMIERETQPKPSASLQLTSTEMNSILNDREAPEFYKEREFNNDGVLVGEERQPRLRTSASNSGQMGGFGLGGGGGGGFGPSTYDGGDGFVDQRLMQSPSEDPSSMGFNHRFGSGFNGGADEFNSMGNSNEGRLMQSPNEYSEINAGSGGFSDNRAGSEYGYSNDYSPNSGLLRAGSSDGFSSDMGEAPSGFGSGGFGERGLSMGGYPNSPMLERHASEIQGAQGFEHGQLAGDMGAMHNGRLLSAGSHNPGFGMGADDEYSSRFGHSGGRGGMGGFSQRGFATQNNMMLRGNSMLTNSMQDVGSMRLMRDASSQGSGGSNRLMPLTPVIPVAEEVPSSSNYREVSSGKMLMKPQDQFNAFTRQQEQSQPQIHEGLEEDPSDTSESNESDEGGRAGNSNMQGEQTDANGNIVGDESMPTTQASIHDMQVRAAKNANVDQSGNGPSLVLNVPPPNIDNSLQSRPSVEFSRYGSAGYLRPSLSSESSQNSQSNAPTYSLRQKVLKKVMNTQQQDRPSEYDPAENPAHSGKYIID